MKKLEAPTRPHRPLRFAPQQRRKTQGAMGMMRVCDKSTLDTPHAGTSPALGEKWGKSWKSETLNKLKGIIHYKG